MLTRKQVGELRRRLLNKGSEIDDALTWLLAHDRVHLEKLLADGPPGETPEERLRRFLDLIDRRLRAIDRAQLGVCEQCGSEIPFAELDAVPWQTACRRCRLAGADAGARP